ncbi:hypothetical protein CEXT_689881 [Caerostris extrusa]|uniref:Uncharacterized protein n=1 Tax=Caerostris extrusa TaxID=172846 RepID=A0AAV4TAC2_CAEEX|nr:hypothetical protein CEXT_689881 [Caerostris extrusa]
MIFHPAQKVDSLIDRGHARIHPPRHLLVPYPPAGRTTAPNASPPFLRGVNLKPKTMDAVVIATEASSVSLASVKREQRGAFLGLDQRRPW